MDEIVEGGLDGQQGKKRAQTRCVIFLMYKIFILFLLPSSQRRPMKANAGQRRPTQAHEGPQQPTTANEGQCRSTKTHSSQRRPTKANTSVHSSAGSQQFSSQFSRMGGRTGLNQTSATLSVGFIVALNGAS